MSESSRPLLAPRQIENADATEPSAPSFENLEQDDDRKRRMWIRSIYMFLSGQFTLFAVITCLFVYIPHLRKVFRKDVFDKIFLTSIIGLPIAAFLVALAFFPSWRRRLAYPALIIITFSLAFLLSYVMTRDNAFSMMMSVLVVDGTAVTIFGSSFIKFLNMASKKGMFIPPMLTIAGNAIYPALTGTGYVHTIVPTLTTSCLVSHLSVNAVSLLKDPNFDLDAKDYSYAFTQVYMKLGIYDGVKGLFSRRHTYQEIST